MSTWADLETTVVESLRAIAGGGASPLLPTVAGRAPADRKSLAAAIAQERLPAAYVIVDGRGALERSSGRPGKMDLTVLLAARNLRGESENRADDVDSFGLFTLAESAASTLVNLEVIPGSRLKLTHEAGTPGTDGASLWEQTYEVRRLAETTAPTFGDAALAGDGATVRVDLGELRMAASSFSFPGIDGVFERRLGARERAIWWRGELRGDNDLLNLIESNIENELRDGQAKLMVDAYGRQHEACVLKAFRRTAPRTCDESTGEAVQDFELEFMQLQG